MWLRQRAGDLPLKAVDFQTAPSTQHLLRATANMLLLVLIVLWSVAVALQTGLVSRNETFTGPFAAEAVPGSQIKILQLKKMFVVRGFIRARSDTEGISSLRLWIDGHPVGPAHVLHESLRDGAPGYSHWANLVYFVLPPGIPNSAQTMVRAEYPVQTPPRRASLLFVLAAFLTYGLHRRHIRAWLKCDAHASRVATALPHYTLFAFGWILAAAGAAYLSILVWGIATGDALPLAIPFRSRTAKEILEWLDPAIPLSLLLLTIFGVTMGWLAAISPAKKRALQRADLSGLRWMRRYGLAVLALYYLASVGATWAGSFRHGTSQALLGLIPFFDAAGYFADVTAFLRDGAWSEFTSRRPLPGAFRTSILLLGDMRYAIAIVLQAMAIAAVVYFGAMAIMRWRGLWAGIAYLALSYILVRSHLSTTMTEPVALIVALGSIPFFIEALHHKARLSGMLAVLLMSAAVWMRPGAMFLIPALTLWFGLSFGTSPFERAKQFGTACSIVLAVLAFDALLGRMFGSGSPGNFGHVVCGLSIGEDWSGCLTRYPEELAQHSQSAEELQKWLYSKAIENLGRDLRPILKIVIHDPIRFLTETPRTMLTGYSQIGIPIWFPTGLWVISIFVLYLATLRRGLSSSEARFWSFVALAVMASTTLFYFNDGVRAFTASYPLIALFIALATRSDSSVTVTRQARTIREFRAGRWSIAAAAALLIILPAAGRELYRVGAIVLAHSPGSNEKIAVVRGVSSSGILVIADDKPLPHGVRSIHFSDFAENIRRTNIEFNQGIISPTSPPLPFGFVIMPRLDTPSAGAMTLITPPKMIAESDVGAWRVTYTDWNPTGKLYSQNWSYVTGATPYVASGGSDK